jgi:hypothetical protein
MTFYTLLDHVANSEMNAQLIQGKPQRGRLERMIRENILGVEFSHVHRVNSVYSVTAIEVMKPPPPPLIPHLTVIVVVMFGLDGAFAAVYPCLLTVIPMVK